MLIEELEVEQSVVQLPQRQKSRSQRKNQAKFSVSNDKEYLENRMPLIAKKLKRVKKPVKLHENKAKSEEKYSGGPLYQIFIAKYPELQALSIRFSTTFERRPKSPSVFANSPCLKKSPQLKNSDKEAEVRDTEYQEASPKQVKTTPRKNRHRIDDKPCNIFTVGL